MPIRLIVLDDQTLVRQGIINLLQLAPDLEVVAQASDGREVVTLVRHYQPDLLLMDIRMPQVSGIDALQLLQQAGLSTPVLLLTTFDDHQLVMQAMLHGARGYLLKDVALEQLLDAVRSVASGGNLWQPAMTQRILQHRSGDVPGDSEALSGKELEVLRLLAAGFSNKEIAQSVFKSEGTVKNQVSAILAKLGVRDRTKAVLKAIDLGLLQ
jgi:DNA-binding NarL/FixJ family response regulator